MITFRCPNAQCPKTFSVKDEFGGKKTKCPTCGALIVVPIPQEVHPEPFPSSQVVPVVSTPPPLQSRTSPTAPTIAVNPARSKPRKHPKLLDRARTLWQKKRNRALIGAIVGGVLLLSFCVVVALLMVGSGTMSSGPDHAFLSFVQAVEGGDVERAFSLEAIPKTRLSGKFKDEIDATKREYAKHFEGSPSRYSGPVGTPRITGWPIKDLGKSSLVSDIRLLIPKGSTYKISDIVYSDKPVNEYQREAARLLIEVQYSAENHPVYVSSMRGIPIQSGGGLAPIPSVFGGKCIFTVDDPFFSVREYSSEYSPHKTRLEYDRKDVKRAVLDVVALKIDGSWLIGQHKIFLVDDSGKRSREGGLFLRENTGF
jgi:hypothetical protein